MSGGTLALVLRAAISVLFLATGPAAWGQAAGSGFATTWWVNPIGIPFGWYTAEVDRQLNARVSAGVTGTHLEVDKGSYTSVDAKVRFHFDRDAPRGLAVGVAAGFTHLEEGSLGETGPSLALFADYNWIVPRWQRLMIGTGAGLKHLPGIDKDFRDLNTTYPTVRVMLGLRF